MVETNCQLHVAGLLGMELDMDTRSKPRSLIAPMKPASMSGMHVMLGCFSALSVLFYFRPP
jgi:hypothetical protein